MELSKTRISIFNKKPDVSMLFHAGVAIFILIIVISGISDCKMITVLNDEFGYSGNAAVMAGYPWKSLLQHTPYYSAGYSAILSVIFRVTNDPTKAYRTAVVFNALCLYLSYIFAVLTSRDLFPQNRKLMNCLISFSSVALSSNLFHIRLAWPEEYLILLYWILVYIVVQLNKRCCVKSLLALYISMLLLYTTHQRTIGILFMVFLYGFVILIYNKSRWYLYVLHFSCLLLVYFAQRGLVDYQWTLVDGFRVSNLNDLSLSTGVVSEYWGKLTSNIFSLLMSICGKTLVSIISTCGTCCLVVVKMCERIIKKKYSPLFWARLFIVTSFLMMLLLQSVKMMNGGRKDIVVYSRYMDFVFGPILLVGINEITRKWNRVLVVLTLSSVAIFTSFIDRLSWSYTEDGFNVFCSPIFGALDVFVDHKTTNIVVVLVFFSVLCFSVLASLKKEKHQKIAMCSFLIILNIFATHNANLPFNKFKNECISQTEAAYSAVENLPHSNINYLCNIEENMYCGEVKYLQFVLWDEEIAVWDSEDSMELDSNSLLIVSRADKNEYDILEDAEKVYSNEYYTIYSMSGE